MPVSVMNGVLSIMGSSFSRRNALKLISGSLIGAPAAANASPFTMSTAFSLSSFFSVDAFGDTPDAAIKREWLTGGTSVLKELSYPSPFTRNTINQTCHILPRLTKGPCYSDSPVRKDISVGQDGLPIRIHFRVVDERCEPIENMSVDIWHCDPNGIYSGDSMRSSNMCTSGNDDYLKHDWFRGIQFSDSNGEVYFESCFPGWYPGRAVHIHITLTNGNRSHTTQISFDDSLVKNITSKADIYAVRGTPNTSNDSDRIFPDRGDKTFEMNTEQLEDGSLLAWKTLVVPI